ncbi:Transcriptional regulator [Amycolatopsis camponoti]|uniref:Transcriptional regulator n=1 Tax=Amycolatopsis camponoti TaxID=2606593 RepID=A0A6I8LIQ9_9PSEU|nr:AraC family transcriptional regulator [Amycolatopsis camponoti]VVJ16941.1 Transcriptional regulator [Amycolatopsis camponoti]
MCLSLKAAAHEHFRELALLRRARDRIDREPALDVEALARGAGMTAAQFLRRFRDAYGQSPHAYRRAALAARTLTFDRVLETR